MIFFAVPLQPETKRQVVGRPPTKERCSAARRDEEAEDRDKNPLTAKGGSKDCESLRKQHHTRLHIQCGEKEHNKKQLLMEDEWMGAQPDMPAEALRYKHYRTINTTAIYVSECGGVMTKSPNMGIRYAKYATYVCPAMKGRFKYPEIHFMSSNSLGGTRHFYVHRLVAEVWLHPKNLFEIEVDHLDGNIMNFHVLNLEWVTREENCRRRNEKHHYKQYNPKRLKV